MGDTPKFRKGTFEIYIVDNFQILRDEEKKDRRVWVIAQKSQLLYYVNAERATLNYTKQPPISGWKPVSLWVSMPCPFVAVLCVSFFIFIFIYFLCVLN